MNSANSKKKSSRWIGLVTRLAVTLTSAFGVVAATASTFHVSPVRVDVGGISRSGVITIRNASETDSVVIQASTFKWSQVDGEDVNSPTNDLIVNPPIFTIEAGGKQTVRVGPKDLRLAASSDSELTYRLLLSEIPQPLPSGTLAVAVSLNLSVPVYFEPRAGSVDKTAPKITLRRNDKDNLIAHVLNDGAKSMKITNIQLVDRTTRAVIAHTEGFRHVLSKSIITWPLSPYPAPISNVAFVVTSDRGVHNLEVDAGDMISSADTPSGATKRRSP